MHYKDFRVQIILRLSLVTLGIFGLVYYSYISTNYIRLFFISVFIIMLLVELFHYINRANKDIRYFLQAIIHNDFTLKYPSQKKGKTFSGLYDTFNLVNHKFIEANQQNAAQYQYITTLIHQLAIGVLSYDEKERIQLINKPFKLLIGKRELVHLKSIQKINLALYEGIKNIKSGESQLIKTSLNNYIYQLSINASEFKLRGRYYKLISVQDIKGELDENEMLAWQKLIRVLTHEIMNSIAPITSLSGTLNQMVSHVIKGENSLTIKQLDQLVSGLDAIENRSEGLLNFTQAYRSLTRIPLPQLKTIEGQAYFQRLIALFKPTLTKTHIEFEYHIPNEQFFLQIDPDLMEQVLINLLKNAKEAILETSDKQGEVLLHVNTLANNQCKIFIKDNAGGIPEEVAEKIFIPFYTTKNEGSGIGLSLVKQIVHLHKGTVDFQSDPDKGTTTFELIF